LQLPVFAPFLYLDQCKRIFFCQFGDVFHNTKVKGPALYTPAPFIFH
jgi:hypothetical protein